MTRGGRAVRGEHTCDISRLRRLIFVPDPPPTKKTMLPNGNPDYKKVGAVKIIGMDNTHFNRTDQDNHANFMQPQSETQYESQHNGTTSQE